MAHHVHVHRWPWLNKKMRMAAGRAKYPAAIRSPMNIGGNNMQRRIVVLAAPSALAAFAIAPLVASADKPGGNPFRVPVTAPAIDPATGLTAGTFTGTATVQKFTAQGGTLLAQVKVVGQVLSTADALLQQVSQVVTVPVTTAQGTCDILTLDIGAIHLDLLGLVVDIAPIHISITAQQGPGNLLGNLLCAIAGLLDANAIGNALADLLNRLLRLFQ